GVEEDAGPELEPGGRELLHAREIARLEDLGVDARGAARELLAARHRRRGRLGDGRRGLMRLPPEPIREPHHLPLLKRRANRPGSSSKSITGSCRCRSPSSAPATPSTSPWTPEPPS